MNVAEKLLAQIQGIKSKNWIRDAWDQLHPLPGGKLVFSKAINRFVPYTGTIDARVDELQRGSSTVRLRDQKAVRNHLGSIHAIALANLAELAGNLALIYSMPDDARFIVAGFTIEYEKKARGTIIANGQCLPVETNERMEHQVDVTLRNESEENVAVAKLRTLVGPKK